MPKKACRFGFKENPSKYKKGRCQFCDLPEEAHGAAGAGGAKKEEKVEKAAKTPTQPAPEASTLTSPSTDSQSAAAPEKPTAAASASASASASAADTATEVTTAAAPQAQSTASSSPTPATTTQTTKKKQNKACKFGFKPKSKYQKDKCATCGQSEADHAEVMAELEAKRAKEEAEASAWAEQQAIKRAEEEEAAKIRKAAAAEEAKEKKAKEDALREKARARLEQQEKERKAEDDAIIAALKAGQAPPKRKTKPLKQYEILDWAAEIAARFGINVVAFTNPSWKDGMAFAALAANFRPDLIDITKLDPSKGEENCITAFEALKKAGVAIYLDPEDVKDADDKSIATQIFAVYSWQWKEPHLSVENPPQVSGGARSK